MPPICRSGGRLIAQGKVFVRVRPGVWELETRVVMERILGRPLRKGERVEHRNGIKTDNRPENLRLVVHPIPNPWMDCLCGCGMRVRSRFVNGNGRSAARSKGQRKKGFVLGHNARLQGKRLTPVKGGAGQ